MSPELVVTIWLCAVPPVAVGLYPWARWEQFQGPEYAAVFFAFFWPILLPLAAVIGCLYLFAKSVKAVWER